MSTSTPDFNNMTAEQIKQFIEAQPAEQEVEQPRDEQGRFIAATEEQPAVEETEVPQTEEEPQQYFHREEIDNGTGAGKEVFTGIGNSPEEAVQDCLRQVVESKAHATRKIRELSQAPIVQAPPVEESLDEGTAIVRMQSEPLSVINELVEKRLAQTLAERDRAEASRRQAEQTAEQASVSFVQATPEYYPNESNGKKMIRWMELNGRNGTLEDMREAYADLSRDGLLAPRPAAEPQARAVRSSGLSTRRSPAAPVKTAAQIQQEAAKLTKEQLLELAGGYQNIY